MNLSEDIINLNEADKFKKIAQMVQNNDHTGAYIASAKILKDKKMEQAFLGMDAVRDLYNGFDGNASALNYSLFKMLRVRMEKKLSPEDFDAWQDAM